MKKILIFVSAILFLSACQSNQPSNSATIDSAANKTIVNSNSAANSMTANAGVKTCQTTGIVTEIKLPSGEIEVKHEECKPIMPAMTMLFSVKNKAELQDLKVGDTVEFTLEDNGGGAQTITSVKKAK